MFRSKANPEPERAPVTARRRGSIPNPQMQAVLDELAKLSRKPIETLTPEEARRQPSVMDAVKSLLEGQGKLARPEPVGYVRDVKIPGPARKIAARVYVPGGDGPFPVTVYWHGGGWVIGNIDTYDASCRAICNASRSVVVSCHYRQAPEHPYPAAPDDALAAYQWIAKNAAVLRGDHRRIAVAGESAGGNLAAAVCLRARDQKLPMPIHQLLIYPMLNNNFHSASYREYGNAKPLNERMMLWFMGHYVGHQPEGVMSSRAFPVKAHDLSKLPSATIINAEIDPLRDDGKLYADRLRAAGVPATQHTYSGVTHEFFGMGAVLVDAKRAVAEAAEGLKSSFRRYH